MTKIINWVCGSFFRTIGRVIAFLVIGCLVALIIDKSDIKITDLFNLEVQASTMYGNAFMNNMSLKDGTNTYTLNYRNDGYYAYNLSNVSGEKNYIFKFDTINLNSNVKELTFNIKYLPNYTQYSSVYEYLENTDFSCTKSDVSNAVGNDFIYDANGNVSGSYHYRDYYVSEWTCAYESLNSSLSGTTTQQNFDFSINVSYIYSNNEWNYTPCYVKSFGGSSFTISCPVMTNNIDGIKVGISATQTHNATIGITSLFTYELDGTTAIIDNQNQNTNATIENQNQNTQQQINSQQVCTYIDKVNIIEDGYLSSNGTKIVNSNWGLTDYITINKDSKITVVDDLPNGQSSYLCFYNINKELISCKELRTLVANEELIIPDYSSYFRSPIWKSTNRPTYNICENGNQAMANTINDTNVSESESEASSFFSSFTIQDHGGLSAIVTAPLQTISNLLSNTCTDLVLPLPYVNENITLPCLSDIYSEHFGAFFTIYQALILALVSYRCLRSLFFDVRGFIDPNDGRIEVLDL